MASSIVRRISPSLCYQTVKNHKFGLTSCYRLTTAAMNMSCTAKPPPPPPSTTLDPPSKFSPWLMLSPDSKCGDIQYNFYCPANNKILPFNKSSGELPPVDAKLVGSSHGWLALFDDKTNRVFLSNPISGQHVKLPPIDTLPDPDVNLLAGRGQVSKLILSCSPNEDDCRALMSFGPKDRLAFCAPRAAAADWIPIGDLYCGEDYQYTLDLISDREQKERNYEDFVYSTRHNLFFCITDRNTELEAWDLRDPLSPKIDWKIPFNEDLGFSHPVYPWGRNKKQWARIDKCFHPKYLVFSDHSDELFLVVRHVVLRMRPDGSSADRIYFFGYNSPSWDHRYPYKTIDFNVFKIDRETRKLKHMEGSLEGLAIFVGMNHSFAVLATEFPGLKADSVYFTDEDRRITPNWLARTSFGGHDNGVFDYRERSISSCYYPVDYEKITRIVPPPMWFTPRVVNYN